MHNMIIENERGQKLDNSFYELMGRLMPVHWFDTKNGNRFSMLRIQTYPQFI
jgi:hypothetical protein